MLLKVFKSKDFDLTGEGDGGLTSVLRTASENNEEDHRGAYLGFPKWGIPFYFFYQSF